MTDLHTAAKQALEALEEIALAGMSVSPEMIDSKEAFHARQAWRFIGIAARALEPVKKALAEQPAQQDPVDWEAVAADQALTIAIMKVQLEGLPGKEQLPWFKDEIAAHGIGEKK